MASEHTHKGRILNKKDAESKTKDSVTNKDD